MVMMNAKRAILLHDFSYTDEDGLRIDLHQGETLVLHSQIDSKWWLVQRVLHGVPIPPSVKSNGNSKKKKKSKKFPIPCFCVPTSHLRIINEEYARIDCDLKHDKLSDVEQKSDEALGSSRDSLDLIADRNAICDDEARLEGIYMEPFSEIQPRRTRPVPDYVNISQFEPKSNEEAISRLKEQPPSIDEPGVQLKRHLIDQWTEYVDQSGRKFYYNLATGITSWKPPRRTTRVESSDVIAATTSSKPTADSEPVISNNVMKIVQNFNDDDLLLSNLKRTPTSQARSRGKSNQSPVDVISQLLSTCPPLGWTRHLDSDTDEVYFVHIDNDVKWFCKQDENGRIYFYEKSSQSVTDQLPNYENLSKLDRTEYPNNLNEEPIRISHHERSVRAHSVAVVSNSLPGDSSSFHDIKFQSEFKHSSPFQEVSSVVPPLPSKVDPSDIIIEGKLNRARIMMAGKPIRKHWGTSYAVLIQHYLLLYKDQKAMSTNSKLDSVIGLVNSSLEWCQNESSRKNCFKLVTFHDQFLLHDDNQERCTKWFQAIALCIDKLKLIRLDPIPAGSIKRSSSTKQYRRFEESKAMCAGHSTTLPPNIQPIMPETKKLKIRERLLQFLRKRPTMESLREKGIFKDENVFGCNLESLCARDKLLVPKFVQQCIQAIEVKDITADGIYRACGNLSSVQKLRFEINQDNYQEIWKEDDVHVLTGLLKMFFREMKEPLFPCDRFENLMSYLAIAHHESKLNSFKNLVHNLPEANFNTLKLLLDHLLRVTQHCKQNRMHIQNLAIVFGPTLIRPMSDLNNLVLDMMLQVQQSQVVEFLLIEYQAIFLE